MKFFMENDCLLPSTFSKLKNSFKNWTFEKDLLEIVPHHICYNPILSIRINTQRHIDELVKKISESSVEADHQLRFITDNFKKIYFSTSINKNRIHFSINRIGTQNLDYSYHFIFQHKTKSFHLIIIFDRDL